MKKIQKNQAKRTIDVSSNIQSLRTTLITYIKTACTLYGCIEVQPVDSNDFQIVLYNESFRDYEVMLLYKILLDEEDKLLVGVDDIGQSGILWKKGELLQLESLYKIYGWLIEKGYLTIKAHHEKA